MATFQVPQFIDQKPKIVGPLTLSQFFYLAGAGAVSFVSFYAFNLVLWLMITVLVAAVGVGLAFVKVNGQDMASILRAALGYALHPRIYTWQRTFPQTSFSTDETDPIQNIRKHMNFEEKLKSIALSVTTGRAAPTAGPDARASERGGYGVATFTTGERRAVRRVDFTE